MASRNVSATLIAVIVLAAVTVSGPSSANASDWTVAGGGSWTVVDKWSSGIPNSVDAVAKFAHDTPDASDFVITSVSGTVGTLVLQDTNSSANYGWELQGGPLTLDVSTGNVQINFRESLHEIAAPIVLMDDLDVTYTRVGADRRANLNGAITSGAGLTTNVHVNRINPWGSGSYGRVVFYGNNTFTGNLTVHNGNLQVGSSGNAISDTADVEVSSGAMLTMIKSEAINALNGQGTVRTHPGFGTCTLTVGGSGGSGTFSGVVRDDGTGITALLKTGVGTQVLGGANTYTGGTKINQGVLQFGHNNVLADTGTVEIDGGELDLDSYSDTVGAVTLNAGSIIGATGVLTGASYVVKSGTIGAILGGAGSLLKSDAGSVTLAAANTYTGATTVSAGRLLLDNPAALGSSASVIQLGDAGTGASDVILLTNVWPQQGNPAAFTISRGINVNNLGTGKAVIGSNAEGASGKYVVFSGPITMDKNLHLQGLNVDRTTFSGSISGIGDLYIDGPRRITFENTNTYLGNTYIIAGTAQFQNGKAIPDASTVTMSSGATLLVWNASEAIDGLNGAGSVAIGYTSRTFTVGAGGGSGAFSGSLGQTSGGVLSLLKAGAGTQTLSGASTYSGTTTVSAGTLILGHDAALGVATSTIQLGDSNTGAADIALLTNGPRTITRNINVNNLGTGTVTLGSNSTDNGVHFFTGSITIDRSIQLQGTTAGRTTFTGSISGTGDVTIIGPSRITFEGANTYDGDTFVSAGILQFGYPGSTRSHIPDTSNVTVANGAVVQLYSVTEAINGLFGEGIVRPVASSATLIVGAADGDGSFVGVLQNESSSNKLAFGKTGTGRQTLAGMSTYTGPTTVSQGILAVNGSIAASSGVLVDTGATLQGCGYVSAVGGAGLISPGNSAGILTAPSVGPSLGTDFAFEFGQMGSPGYANAVDSVNDVFRLTAPTPFLAALDAGNTVDVYLGVDGLRWGVTFRGGFYTDRDEEFLSSIDAATFNYYVLGDGGGEHEFNGQGYYALTESWPTWSFELATVPDAAAFSGGAAAGYVMQLTAVPELGSLILLACGLFALLMSRRRKS